jgi:outer membrane receptor for ferrienterochelin and colicins
MKKFNFALVFFLLIISYTSFSQGKPQSTTIKITGKVIEKSSKQTLEYTTITITQPNSPKPVAGGITNPKGDFIVEVAPGVYDIRIEFISFKPVIFKGRNLTSNTNLGQIVLEEDATQLNEVVVRAENTTITVKLDKKIYSVGNDLMVKGGTVSDVLDNIPSVSVDAEGAVSLRGNESVTILIDGKPSNAININEALRLIPADAIDKVEVITNPSARYDAEGGAGILNIVLKKGKNQGFNGTFIAASGFPETNSISGTLNYKTKKYNLFTNQGYSYRNNPGNARIESEYLTPNADSPDFILETRKNERINKGYNGNLGIELYLNESTSWTNTINYRNTKKNEASDVNYNNQFYANLANNFDRTRFSQGNADENGFEFKSSLQKKFKKDGHKLDIDVQISTNDENENANILDSGNGNDVTQNIQKQDRQLYQLDYVLPIGEKGQFEAGYRGSFTNQLTDVTVFNNAVLNTNFTNELEYVENVNAFYTQYGFKKNKFSYLFGLRWEDSTIEVNRITQSDFNTKKYNNFFPSAFVTYELSEDSNLSLNYSRRISRPRGRFINPFSNYSSNINIFQGNPDLDPAMTDAVDFGYLKKWGKFILNTSLYTNKSTDVFQFVRINSGTQVNGIPVIITTPINLATEYRTGFEFNLNYSPFKCWKLNSNFNAFNVTTDGDYTYTDFNNQQVTQNFDNNASTWSAKLNSKITLPNKIDWQTNMNYNGDQKIRQGKNIGIFSMNLGFSKDVMKDKGTFAFGVSDVFNSRKMKSEIILETPQQVNSYSEMQFRERQFTLSFTYRFNKPKNEKERQPKREMENGGEEFPG